MSRKRNKALQRVQSTQMVSTADFNKYIEARKVTVDNVGGKIKQSEITTDSFSNFVARIGIQTGNLSSQGYYDLGPFITRNRLELEAAYRGNWLVGKIVDCVAEDMTRDGITMNSEMEPDDISKLNVALSTFGVWHDICSGLKWGRLYGGALCVMMIDGADYSKPLNIDAIGKDKFKGLAVLDRWMVQPSMGELIKDLGKDMGKPLYYEAMPGVSTFPAMKIHHSRVLRFEGVELPYYQKLFENLWGLSVVERILDRLMAFDSATLGAAQLLYKAHLRVLKIKNFREALTAGGAAETAMMKQFRYIQLMQSNEGLTVLDAEDDFDTHSYSFAGVSDALQQFGQQVSGGEEIPLVRLFGQSPAGFSTGETDIRNYYDSINKRQKNDLRHQLDKLLAVMSKSVLGKPLPEDFEFDFVSLWQLSETEKSQIAQTDSTTIKGVVDDGLISKSTGLKELVQLSRITGRFTNITEEDIEAAENEPPPSSGLLPGAEETKKEPEEAEEPNERLGAANPDLEKETVPAGDRKTFKDMLSSLKRWIKRKRY